MISQKPKITPNKLLYLLLLSVAILFFSYVMLLYSKALLVQWMGNLYPIKKIVISGVSNEKVKKISKILSIKKNQSLLSIDSRFLKRKILSNFEDIKVLKITKKYPQTLAISLSQITEDLIIKINDKIYLGFLLKENKIIHYNLTEIANKNALYLSLQVSSKIEQKLLLDPNNIQKYINENRTFNKIFQSLQKLHLTEVDFFDCVSLIDINKKIIYSKNFPATIYMTDFSLPSFTKAKYAYLYGATLYHKQRKTKKNKSIQPSTFNQEHITIDLRLNNLVKYAFQNNKRLIP